MAGESITPSARSEEISLPFFDTSKSAILQSSAFVTATSLSAVYDLFSLPHSTFTFNIIRRLRVYSPEKSLSSNSSCECSREAIKPSLPQFMPSIGFSNSQPLRAFEYRSVTTDRNNHITLLYTLVFATESDIELSENVLIASIHKKFCTIFVQPFICCGRILKAMSFIKIWIKIDFHNITTLAFSL